MARRDTYWADRVLAQEAKALERSTKRTQEELAAIYRQSAREIRDEMLAVASKVADAKAAGEQVLMNDYFRNNRYWRLLERLNGLLNDLGQSQIEVTEPALLALYDETVSLIDEQAPAALVNAAMLRPSAVDGRQALFQTWCLDGKSFSDRVWEDKARMLVEFKKELERSTIQGKSPWATAQGVADRLKVSESNAYRLMRTESAHAQIYAQTQRYKELGYTRGRFHADASACDECRAHDGQEYTLEQVQTMIPVHPNCTCSYTPIR